MAMGVWRKMLHCKIFLSTYTWPTHVHVPTNAEIYIKYMIRISASSFAIYVILLDCQEGGTALHDETLRIGMKSGHNDSRDFWNAHSIPVATWPAKIVLDVSFFQ